MEQSHGWEMGVGPSVVVMDKGKARSLTTTTMQDDVYAFVFGQPGLVEVLVAGLGVQGSKITGISPWHWACARHGARASMGVTVATSRCAPRPWGA